MPRTHHWSKIWWHGEHAQGPGPILSTGVCACVDLTVLKLWLGLGVCTPTHTEDMNHRKLPQLSCLILTFPSKAVRRGILTVSGTHCILFRGHPESRLCKAWKETPHYSPIWVTACLWFVWNSKAQALPWSSYGCFYIDGLPACMCCTNVLEQGCPEFIFCFHFTAVSAPLLDFQPGRKWQDEKLVLCSETIQMPPGGTRKINHMRMPTYWHWGVFWNVSAEEADISI